eukprot:TRINITY_DN2350_c0_g1_i1.p1 TRINITY_DN2350_c0_g1~~TRINITY_DN2350_c0_g1_i1.p1  ORF type:complete len:138 (-),score=29.99 TRINITY_DN2350_c0_g1_i1:93-506(-)
MKRSSEDDLHNAPKKPKTDQSPTNIPDPSSPDQTTSTEPLNDIDYTCFWDECEYSRQSYVGAELTREMIDHAESKFGYKLPEAYINLMKIQNGGIINKCRITGADNIEVTAIFGLDSSKTYSLVMIFDVLLFIEFVR